MSQDRTKAAEPATSLTLLHPLVAIMVPLAYRPAVAALWRLDAAFGQALKQANEPALALMRLMWWRDAIETFHGNRDPLLEDIEKMVIPQMGKASLLDLNDAWADFSETETVDVAALKSFARRRGEVLYSLSSRLMGSDETLGQGSLEAAGEYWALVDTAVHLSNTALRSTLLDGLATTRPPLPKRRYARSLGALTALAQMRARSAGKARALQEQAMLLRFGLIGA